MSCENCGQCCIFTNGAPFLHPSDLKNWQEHNQWSILARVRLTIGRISAESEPTQEITFWEKHGTHECIFRVNGACSIYSSRPIACRMYPYPLSDTCINDKTIPAPDKILARRWNRSLKEYNRWDYKMRQDYVDRLLKIARRMDKTGFKPPTIDACKT